MSKTTAITSGHNRLEIPTPVKTIEQTLARKTVRKLSDLFSSLFFSTSSRQEQDKVNAFLESKRSQPNAWRWYL